MLSKRASKRAPTTTKPRAAKRTPTKVAATAKPRTSTKPAPATAAVDSSAIDLLIPRAAKAPAVRAELRAMPPADVVPRLLVAMADARPAVRSLAYELSTATPAHREHTPLATIIAGLADPDPKVRLSVLLALNRGFGIKNDAVYAPRREEIRDSLARLLVDPDKRVKSQSAVVWGRLGLGELPR